MADDKSVGTETVKASVKGLEGTLNDMLVKNAPFQLPENARKWIATYAWIFELLFVILGGLAFFALLGVLGIVSTVAAIPATYGGSYLLFAWLALLVLGAEVVVGAMAVPKLKALKKAGWNLSYYMALFNFAFGVLNAIANAALFGIVTQAISSLIGLYVLFQVRSYFKS